MLVRWERVCCYPERWRQVMKTVTLTDDGDEVVMVEVEGALIGGIDHETFGWYGMEQVINLIQSLGEALEFGVDNEQNIM